MKKFLIFLLFPMFGFSQSIVIEVNQLFEQKRFIKAEEIASDYAKQNPNDLKVIELLGDAYGHQKKWDEAIEEYKKLVDADDDNANYHYKYGGALGMKALEVNKFKALGIIGDVKDAFLSAAELDPKHIDTRWALVELYMQLPGIIGGNKSKSLKYAEELEQLSKVDGYLAKGYVYEYDKEPELAEIYYKKAIEVGGSLTCYDKLTKLYESEKQPKKAIATIERAYEKHNKNHLHYQIGKVSADYNIQLDKGERCLKKYIENHSAKDGVPIEWAYYRLAQIQKHRANKQEALKWIDKALDVRSDFKQAKEEKEIILSL
ncbi:tetratricopeptide repeat protein [Flavobacteriaceae bacterium S0862]|nr:tetratricopeptide repeat protein [Flavobacteriaceae bacterium S0862]